MPPESIAGRYRPVREIGRGSGGSVWLAVDERLSREVAVKQVGYLPGESGHDVARALREARSSAALNHPHVVAIYDVVEDDDRTWLVMEYVPGRTLAELTSQEGALQPARVAAIGAQVAEGLAAAHARGTVHRDVKPGNVMVSGHAGSETAKVTDFGIARTQGDGQLTATGLVTGTPGYFSPELARGGDPIPAADVWALGATLFAAVEGHPPYANRGDNALALLGRIATESPPRPQVGGALGAAIEHMMDPDPAARWSMDHAARELGKAAHPGPEPTPAEEAATTPMTAPVSKPVPAAAAAPPPDPDPGTDPVPEPAGEDRRRSLAPWLAAALTALIVLLLAVVLLPELLGGDEEEPAAGPSEQTSAPPSPRQDEPSPEESQPEEPQETEDPDQQPPDAGDRMAFVEDYYSQLPGDTGTAWTLLDPAMQNQIGRGSYEGFWQSIDSVTVEDARPAGASGVEVSLTYVRNDGSTASEVRRIEVGRASGGYKVVGDEVAG